MFKVSDPAACWCTVQFSTIVDTPFQTSTGLKEQGLSVGCTKTNLTKPMIFDLVRMRLFSQTTRDVEKIHQLRIHLIIWSTSQKECLRSEYLGNSPGVYVYFQFGLRCPSPRMCFTCMWSVLAQLPALSANAWIHSWSVAYTSVQVHMREVAGVEQFPILTCM